MKIAYWSSGKGSSGTTSNLACLSVLGAIGFQKKNILLENHYNLHNLEDAFVSHRWSHVVKEENYYYSQVGLDSLIRRLHSHRLDEENMKASAVELWNHSLYYIPQSHVTNKEVLEYELSRVIHALMRKLEKFGENVTIDTAGREQLSTKVILELADLVVVNLNQDPLLIEDFFKNYESLRKKAVYLIGKYNPDSKCSLRSIMKRYQIEKEEIGVIPYNIEFHDSLSDGSLIKFLTRNYSCKKTDENYYFIREAKRAAKVIVNKMEQLEQGGE